MRTSWWIGVLACALLTCVVDVLRLEAGVRVFDHRVRTTDAYLGELLGGALATSPTIRALVDRLEHSDVIVYLVRDNLTAWALEGKTTFIAARGNVRYVRITIAWERGRRRHVATLAHELQHAVEIADAPTVIDEASLEREYERIGCQRAPHYPGRRAFDTDAAMAAGDRAWREFDARAADD